MPFKRLNLIVGWAVFAVALLTYLLTIEPTTSLWDCGEFIATSYKLEVGHPPGTPFFFLINRLGAMFASDPTAVAPIINGLSALESAFTILFLFWSIAHLGRRIYGKRENELSTDESWAVVGASTIGALAYTFSDTFWFSAVEAEVYALSSLFTAVVFWAILKWENVADEKGSNRWLIFIAYLMGLSIGAHILNLLAIPALVFIFYFKKFPGRPKSDLWKPTLISLVILGAFYKLTPTVVSVGAFVDRMFVNSMGLPVNSGLAFVVVALFVALCYGVWRTHKRQKALLNTIFLSAAMVVIGFSTYGIVLIRASVNPPMNSNNPADPYSLEKFLNRDQYGKNPLLKGETFASDPIGIEFSDEYVFEGGEYKQVRTLSEYTYDPATEVLFPRMYQNSPTNRDRITSEYKSWSNFTGKQVRTERGDLVTIPTFGDNLAFFFGYQVNNMYWRYFLWNFVGRQSDLQYDGITNGNWLSGIDFIDELYLGPQDNLPSEVAANRGRNTYFFLPFILGLLGLFFQLKRDGRNFTVVMMLFLLTGLAIIIYLNQTPLQPRERDYAYAGSFYAFAIWIGLGVLPIYEFIRKKMAARVAAVGAIVLSASVPVVLAVQNWDDHDRSGRTIARDMGYSYLNVMLPNSVLLNHGDNDTFPVWYMQEVEEFRTDVRPMNTSYITGNWYIDQMRVKSNDSEALPLSIPRSKYTAVSSLPTYPVVNIPRPGGGTWTIQEVMAVVNSDDKMTKTRDGQDFIPASRIAVPVNKENVLKSGIVKAEDAHLIEDTIYINLRKDSYHIGELVVLDLIAQSDWSRPIYTTSSSSWLDYGLVTFNKNERYSYMQQMGPVSLLVPFKTEIGDDMGVGYIDTEVLYDNLMNKTLYGNISDPKVYVDSFVENTLQTVKYRESFARLARKFMAEGDTVRAVEVLDRVMEVLPSAQLRNDEYIVPIIEAYWMAGEQEKGDKLAKDYALVMAEYINYYDRFTGKLSKTVENALMDKLRNMYFLSEAAKAHGKIELNESLNSYFQ